VLSTAIYWYTLIKTVWISNVVFCVKVNCYCLFCDTKMLFFFPRWNRDFVYPYAAKNYGKNIAIKRPKPKNVSAPVSAKVKYVDTRRILVALQNANENRERKNGLKIIPRLRATLFLGTISRGGNARVVQWCFAGKFGRKRRGRFRPYASTVLLWYNVYVFLQYEAGQRRRSIKRIRWTKSRKFRSRRDGRRRAGKNPSSGPAGVMTCGGRAKAL